VPIGIGCSFREHEKTTHDVRAVQGSEKGKIGVARQFPSQATIRTQYGGLRGIINRRVTGSRAAVKLFTP
jgi:hypothetical protein